MPLPQKTFLIVNGTMGVGKSAVCRQLYQQLTPSVWLDGDWCWMMSPWQFSEENRQMVEDNITHLLRNFLTNSSFEYVLFSWVIHQEAIFDTILEPLQDLSFTLHKITLTCSEEALRKRMMQDANRTEADIERSLQRLQCYTSMNTIKIDSSDLTAGETVNLIVERICERSVPGQN